ncbi:mechanosensitive ion channel inner membrane domain 1 family protein, partial [Vibrio parahaemolyticus AQ3810]
GWWR